MSYLGSLYFTRTNYNFKFKFISNHIRSAWNLEEVKFESLIELALGKSSSWVEVDLELEWSFPGYKMKTLNRIMTMNETQSKRLRGEK